MDKTFDATVRRKEKIFATDKKQRTDENKCQVVLVSVQGMIGKFWDIYIDLYRVNIPSTNVSPVKESFEAHFYNRYKRKCKQRYNLL